MGIVFFAKLGSFTEHVCQNEICTVLYPRFVQGYQYVISRGDKGLSNAVPSMNHEQIPARSRRCGSRSRSLMVGGRMYATIPGKLLMTLRAQLQHPHNIQSHNMQFSCSLRNILTCVFPNAPIRVFSNTPHLCLQTRLRVPCVK